AERIGEGEGHSAINIGNRIVEDGDAKGLDGFAGGENERAVGGGIMRAGSGGAVAGGKVHRNRVGCPQLAQDSDGDVGSILPHPVIAGAKDKAAAPDLVAAVEEGDV